MTEKISKTIIDPNTWKRKKNFDFFRDFINPNLGVSVRVDVSHAYSQAKEKHYSFFLSYFHALLCASNGIEEFHYRLDREGNIVYYDRINGLAPIRVEEYDNFAELRFPYYENFSDFCVHAEEIKKQAAITDPYAQEYGLTDYNVFFVSALPNLDFTFICSTQRSRLGNDYPLCIVGKMGADMTIPITLTVHHGFIDGEHISRFFTMLQQKLDS